MLIFYKANAEFHFFFFLVVSLAKVPKQLVTI